MCKSCDIHTLSLKIRKCESQFVSRPSLTGSMTPDNFLSKSDDWFNARKQLLMKNSNYYFCIISLTRVH